MNQNEQTIVMLI